MQLLCSNSSCVECLTYVGEDLQGLGGVGWVKASPGMTRSACDADIRVLVAMMIECSHSTCQTSAAVHSLATCNAHAQLHAQLHTQKCEC